MVRRAAARIRYEYRPNVRPALHYGRIGKRDTRIQAGGMAPGVQDGEWKGVEERESGLGLGIIDLIRPLSDTDGT